MIENLGLPGFFLLHHEILELARQVAFEVRGADSARALLPPGCGRGSSVSSIVCYLAGLSHIDPVENDLAIGRFLHEDIQGLPDIDIDFARDIREPLIPRIHEHFGYDRAALVATYPSFKAKRSIRELGMALGLPAAELDRVARGSEGWGSEGTVAEDIRVALGAERLTHTRWKWLAKLADEAYGLPRYIGQHPGGMIISTRPLIDCCPGRPLSDARTADGAVGQGLVLGRGVSEDRHFGVGDALRGRTVRGADLQSAPASRSTCRASRSTTRRRSEVHPGSGHDRRVPDRESRADGVAAAHASRDARRTSRSRSRSSDPGQSSAAPSTPTSNAAKRSCVDPNYQVPFLHPSLEEPLSGDARDDRLPRPGDLGIPSVRRASPRGRPRASDARCAASAPSRR